MSGAASTRPQLLKTCVNGFPLSLWKALEWVTLSSPILLSNPSLLPTSPCSYHSQRLSFPAPPIRIFTFHTWDPLTLPWLVVQLKPKFLASRLQSKPLRCKMNAVSAEGKLSSWMTEGKTMSGRALQSSEAAVLLPKRQCWEQEVRGTRIWSWRF